jgi:hypothetical protein
MRLDLIIAWRATNFSKKGCQCNTTAQDIAQIKIIAKTAPRKPRSPTTSMQVENERAQKIVNRD